MMMMLPGVELARRRRLHHHRETPARPSPDHPGVRPGNLPPTAMGEPAVVARRRLEEKLRRFAGSPPSSSPRLSFLFGIGSRSAAAVDGGGERSEQGSASAISETRRDSRSDLCAVCLDEVAEEQSVSVSVTRLPCSHKYHSDCILPWLAAHSDCPCCRELVPTSPRHLEKNSLNDATIAGFTGA